MNLLEILQKLNALHGPSGDETEIAEDIRAMAAPYADEITRDTMGNLIVHKKGKGAKVMVAAHMDSIGFLVTHIEKEGFLRVGKLGGVTPADVLNTPVRLKNGVKGVIVADEKAAGKQPKVDELVLDIGASSREEAERMAQIGDTVVYNTPTFAAGSRIVSPYLDNRVCCAVLLMALEQIKEHDSDLYFAFTVQEELGLRGAKTAAYAIEPDYAVVVDVTISDDTVGANHSGSSKLGGGAAIKVMDASVVSHPAMVQKLEELTTKKKIAAQRDVIRGGGTDAGVMQVSRNGVCTGGVSVPCRYIHTPTEMVEQSDVEACVKLITEFAQTKLPQEM